MQLGHVASRIDFHFVKDMLCMALFWGKSIMHQSRVFTKDFASFAA